MSGKGRVEIGSHPGGHGGRDFLVHIMDHDSTTVDFREDKVGVERSKQSTLVEPCSRVSGGGSHLCSWEVSQQTVGQNGGRDLTVE